jgi:hypothetical protein
MIRRLALLASLACALPLRADDSFTRALSPGDFQAAGLGKLTPDELARLDQLVRGQQTGAVAKAKEETTKSVSLMVRAQVQAEELKKQSAGILEKMKVMLKPGTEIEYTTLDSAIVSIREINYGRGGAVFTLANGQQWMTTEDDDWPSTKAGPVRARVIPGSMGSFFLDIEHGGRPRVRFVGNIAPAGPAPAH